MTDNHNPRETSAVRRPVGIFDSGLGGLTALREIRRILPGEDLIYFGDTGRVPYGTRSHETICHYAVQDLRFLLSEADCKAVVIACGTVTANALPLLQSAFSVPIIGVIDPAAKAAVRATKNGKIGVIATQSSIASGAYDRALAELEPEVSLISRACPLFVPLVENGFVDPDDPIPLLTAERYLADIKASGADTVILGCTHYPLLKGIISKVLPGVALIDTGEEVAHALKTLLDTEEPAEAGTGRTGDVQYFVSDETQGFAAAASRFLGLDITSKAPLGEVRRIDIEAYSGILNP
ncbi:MAG: glutamate racemase [Clostridia bacterium]|nr:glutamate racemase [Clostridia bacterium]